MTWRNWMMIQSSPAFVLVATLPLLLRRDVLRTLAEILRPHVRPARGRDDLLADHLAGTDRFLCVAHDLLAPDEVPNLHGVRARVPQQHLVDRQGLFCANGPRVIPVENDARHRR